jgi:hypothetical protein
MERWKQSNRAITVNSLTQPWPPYVVATALKPSPSWQDAPSSHEFEKGPHPIHRETKQQT